MRLIDADALKRVKFEFGEDFSVIDMARALITAIDIAPTIDPESLRPKGRIIETIENGKMKRVFSCCNTDFTQMTMWMKAKYCPNCGAKMEG